MNNQIVLLLVAVAVIYWYVPDILDRLKYCWNYLVYGIKECLSICGPGMIMNKNGDCVAV